MPETCNPKDCPVSARVEALKEEFNAQTAFSTRLSQRLPGLSRWFSCHSMSRSSFSLTVSKCFSWVLI